MTRLWRVTLCEIEKANEFNTTRHRFFSKYGTFLAAGIARAPDVTRIWNSHRKCVCIETYCTSSEKLMLIEKSESRRDCISSDYFSKLPEERHSSVAVPMQYPKIPQDLNHHLLREVPVVLHLGPHHHHQNCVSPVSVRLVMRFPMCDIVGADGGAPHCG